MGSVGVDMALRGHTEKIEEELIRHYAVVMDAFGKRILNGVKQLDQMEVKIDPRDLPYGSMEREFVERVSKWVSMNAPSKAVGITSTTAENIKWAIIKGTEAGEGIEDIADRIVKQTGGYTAGTINFNRATTIARTETHAAAVAAGDEALEAIGRGGMAREWIAIQDTRTRHSHSLHDKDGGVNRQQRKIGDAFEFIGLKGGRVRLEYPGDPAGPPEEIINCRCVLVGVVEPEDVGDLPGEETLLPPSSAPEGDADNWVDVWGDDPAQDNHNMRVRLNQRYGIKVRQVFNAGSKQQMPTPLSDAEQRILLNAVGREAARLHKQYPNAFSNVLVSTYGTTQGALGQSLQGALVSRYDVSHMLQSAGKPVTDSVYRLNEFGRPNTVSSGARKDWAILVRERGTDWLINSKTVAAADTRWKVLGSTIRHELGHAIIGPASVDRSLLPKIMKHIEEHEFGWLKDTIAAAYKAPHVRELIRGMTRQQLRKFTKQELLGSWKKAVARKWSRKWISDYAGYSKRGTDIHELNSELVAMITDPEYVKGTLPAFLEKHVDSVMKRRFIKKNEIAVWDDGPALPSGIERANPFNSDAELPSGIEEGMRFAMVGDPDDADNPVTDTNISYWTQEQEDEYIRETVGKPLVDFLKSLDDATS